MQYQTLMALTCKVEHINVQIEWNRVDTSLVRGVFYLGGLMKLYNSKTLQIEEMQTVNPNEVNMYVCGPTVYNHIHIGNARPIVVFDTLRRVLETDGYKVKYVSNYTDVDDKIIKKAIEEGATHVRVGTGIFGGRV